jgi:hypothetical protein
MVVVNDPKKMCPRINVMTTVKMTPEFTELLDHFCEPVRNLGTKRNNYYLFPLDRPYVTSFVDFQKPYVRMFMRLLKFTSRLHFTYLQITYKK